MDVDERAAESTGPDPVISDDLERRGRAWLIWSFVLCPCHLPVTLGIVGALFGATAVGGFIVSHGWQTGVLLGALYAAGVWRGFGHLRAARRGGSCSSGECP